MARPYENGWNPRRTRIDTRRQNDPATQAGMRGVHRGMRGEVIGGYTAEGQALGTKAGKAAWKSSIPASVPAAGGAAMEPVSAPAAAPAASAPAARPNALGGGLARWKSMNPGAKAAFSAWSPANDKSINRRLAQRSMVKPAASPAQSFAQAAMPKPAVPSPMPVSDTTAGKARAVGGKPAWKAPMMARR